MPDHPLFYRSVVPLNRETHAALRMKSGRDAFGFARGSQLVPAVLDEFAAACRELPILFIASGGAPSPVFLVGVRPDENLMVDENGAWIGSYVPAFLRRHPFIKGDVEGGESIVCLDETADALMGDHDGEPLFVNGGETPLLRERIDLLNGYADAAQRTGAFGRLLVELSLLKSVTVDFKKPDGGSNAVHGLLAVDEEKLGTLPDDDYLQLRKENLLGPIYAHLLSLGAIDVLGRRATAG